MNDIASVAESARKILQHPFLNALAIRTQLEPVFLGLFFAPK